MFSTRAIAYILGLAFQFQTTDIKALQHHYNKACTFTETQMEISVSESFEVNRTEKSIVKAANPRENYLTLSLSNLDLLSGRFPVTYLYFYPNPTNVSFSAIYASLKKSLAETLSYYYPFAGRIVENKLTREPEIVCSNDGALVVAGHANISMNKVDFNNLNQLLQGKLVSISPDYPLQIQVTQFGCGGISMTFTFDHALGDASSFGNFLLTWAEIARKKPVSCMPDHRRFLRPRCPPTYHHSLNQSFQNCTMEEILSIPTSNILLKRLYHIDAQDIKWLQQLASANGTTRTKIEAFSAYVWKKVVTAIHERHEICKMGWLVDGRGRIHGDRSTLSNYIGNLLSVAIGEASIAELKQGSISDIANKAHNAIAKVTNEAHFLDLIDWIECHRPGMMLSKVVLGRGGPALVMSSGRRFPVAELDYGFGSPALGTVCSTIEKIGVAYMNQRPSASNDGSWTVSAILWPELAAALESESIFQPMSSCHLKHCQPQVDGVKTSQCLSRS